VLSMNSFQTGTNAQNQYGYTRYEMKRLQNAGGSKKPAEDRKKLLRLYVHLDMLNECNMNINNNINWKAWKRRTKHNY
jgi:hypothetical protein